MSYILTFDAGTSSVKCSLVNDRGALEFACTEEYPLYCPGEGRAEQRADDIISAVIKAAKRVNEAANRPDIAVIGITGTMNGCIPLDKNGDVLYPCMIHLDTRAVNEVDRLEAAIGGKFELYRRTGNRPDVHYGLPKMMWLKAREPDVYAKTAVCVNTKDLIYGRLTGNFRGTDYSDASLFGAMNIHTRKWDKDVACAADIDASKLPELRPSTDISGTLSQEAARLMGLKAGIPVAAGCGDGPATTHGSGVYGEKGAYLTVGSSAWVGALSKTPCIDAGMRAFNYTDMDESCTTVCGTVQCASTALDYMLRDVLAITGEDGRIDFGRAEEMCFASPAGANGLIFLPTLMGERCPWWDAKARGTLFGMTLSHTRNDMVRAAYEGIAQELNNCVSVLAENGFAFDSLILSGGGMKGNVYRRIFPDIFGIPARVHLNPREATSLGAAIAAGVGAGIWKSFEEASVCVKTGELICPDEAAMAVYKKQTPVFRRLYSRISAAMHDVYALQAELSQSFLP